MTPKDPLRINARDLKISPPDHVVNSETLPPRGHSWSFHEPPFPSSGHVVYGRLDVPFYVYQELSHGNGFGYRELNYGLRMTSYAMVRKKHAAILP